MKIFTVGSINMDLAIRASAMPEAGQTVRGDGFMANPGGKGANQAVAVAKLGGNSVMVGCVGEAFGEDLLGALSSHGVCTAFVKRRSAPSGIAVIVVAEGDNRIVLDAGANALVDEAQIEEALSSAERGDFLIVQLEIPQPAVRAALSLAKEKGMVTVLNPAPAAKLPPDMLTLCDWFVPNQTEARFYTGIYPEDERGLRRCADALGRMGIRNLLVTMGSSGSACVSDGKIVRVAARKVEAVDTTAAGDTYVGGFAVALSEGKDVAEAMKFATDASALTVTRRGAQVSIPTRAEVLAFGK